MKNKYFTGVAVAKKITVPPPPPTPQPVVIANILPKYILAAATNVIN